MFFFLWTALPPLPPPSLLIVLPLLRVALCPCIYFFVWCFSVRVCVCVQQLPSGESGCGLNPQPPSGGGLRWGRTGEHCVL